MKSHGTSLCVVAVLVEPASVYIVEVGLRPARSLPVRFHPGDVDLRKSGRGQNRRGRSFAR